MRFKFFSVLPLLSLLLKARAASREPAPLVPLLHARATPNACANLNTELVVPDMLGILTAVGVISSTCLCELDIANFLKTNVVGILAVTIAGEAVVTQVLTNLIDSAASQLNCVYPAHSKPACVNGNPCGSQCTDGFTAQPQVNPTTCVCKSPSVICNGMCQSLGSCITTKLKGLGPVFCGISESDYNQ